MLLTSIAILSLAAGAVVCLCSGAAGLAWLWMLPLSFAGSFLALLLLALLFLWAACALVDTGKPQEHDSPFYRGLISLYAPLACSILRMRVHTKGLENTPKEGRFLLVCNHLSNFDPVVLINYFRKSQLAFISKRENSSMFIIGKLMHKIMCQMINRENDREALKTILKCIQLIKDDECSVAVFPEGYCSKDGKLQHMRSGAFKIATKTNVPIAVCTIRNTNQVMHNLMHLKPTDIYLDLVEVIPPDDLKGQTAVDIGSHVFQVMLKDLGPEYTPVWLETNNE